MTFAPVAMAPVAMAPVAGAAAQSPQSGLSDVIEIVKIFRDAGMLGNRGGTENRDSSSDVSSVRAAISELKTGQAELKAGQQDLRGRLINNAGISRAIGEELLKVSHYVGANGQLANHLVDINNTLKDRLPASVPAPAVTGEKAMPEGLEGRLKTIESTLAKLVEKIDAMD